MQALLRESLGAGSLDVMNFLNEVVLRYPEAISFAPGRPSEDHFDVESSAFQMQRYVARLAAAQGVSEHAVYGDLGQYGKTNGLIRELVARQLRLDEQVEVPPEAIIVTVGCQEAMTILMMGLFDPAKDVLLASDPTYIGITGLAHILNVEVHPVETGEDGLHPETLERAFAAVRRAGKRPKAIYDVPDFSNPLGTSMPLEARRRTLAVAREHDVLIFEDNPYGMFAYDHEPAPTLKSLDAGQPGAADGGEPRVIYLGSFSKTLFPGLRLGYLVADQPLRNDRGEPCLLAEELSKVKSLTTVNTSQIIQAMAGGILEEHGGSLRSLVAQKLPFYKTNRDTMLAALESELGRRGLAPGPVTWNRPGGGFFLTLNLPFEFDEPALERCAQDYGVICCPMRFFALRRGHERQARLSFSYVTPQEIEEGIARLARFVADRVRS